MKCKDCNSTGIYQPLIGSPDPCRACSAILVSFDLVYHKGSPKGLDMDIINSLIFIGLKEPLSVFAENGRYCIVDGKKRFAAICRFKTHNPEIFKRICPDNKVSINVRNKL